MKEYLIKSSLKPLYDKEIDGLIIGRTEEEHKRNKEKFLMYVGKLYEKQEESDYYNKKIFVDCCFPHIVYICGRRGSGKSYTLGVIAEELCESGSGIATVIIDPMGIFWAMKEENQVKEEREEIEKEGIQVKGYKNVRVLVPEGLKEEFKGEEIDGSFSIKISEVSVDDWCMIFGLENQRFKVQGLAIETVIEKVKKGYYATVDGKRMYFEGKENYSIDDLIFCLENEEEIISPDKGFAKETRRSLIARFYSTKNWGILSIDGTPLEDICIPDFATVVDVSHPVLSEGLRALVIGTLAKKILKARVEISRKQEVSYVSKKESGKEGSIPVTWLLVDEAHLFVPKGKETPASSPLIDYVKRGRKPGCGLVLATQRPAATDDNILSQVDILIGHTLVIEDDIQAFLKRVPSKLPSELNNSNVIRSLPPGIAILSDQQTPERAMLVEIRTRKSHHAGRIATPGKEKRNEGEIEIEEKKKEMEEEKKENVEKEAVGMEEKKEEEIKPAVSEEIEIKVKVPEGFVVYKVRKKEKKLELKKPDGETTQFDRNYIKINRSPDADIYIPDKMISRKHLVIYFEEGVFVEDEGSTNGTLLNNEEIKGKGRILIQGENSLCIGDTDLIITIKK